ncbi:Phenylacetic acid catabolic protein [Halegenticoccus tardaugens]|uniref:Phenylacetic acid catabolic protein n=1 Tax=Halegenticoccus tardaugens TaxID=2071624 RepID=UPI00100B4A62|nr:Phenylacetic acid catabolic protein [Halegenticoccus tardaugens]
MSEWPTEAVNYIQAIADTKLVLSHRYAEWMLGGPSLEDDIGGASAAQDEVGHVRQLFRLLEQQGRDPQWLEGNRDPEEFCNAEPLDETPDTWAEYVATVSVVDRAAWYMLDSITSEDFRGLVDKIGEDEFFHLEYQDARLETLAEENPVELQQALEAVLPQALTFVGPKGYDADSDPVVQAGFSDRSAAELRSALLAHYETLLAGTGVSLDGVDTEGPTVDEWGSRRRRVSTNAISQSVVDSLVGVKNKQFAAE